MKKNTEIEFVHVMKILELNGVPKQVRSKVAKLLIGHSRGHMKLGDMRESFDKRKKHGALKLTGGDRPGPKTIHNAEAVLTFLEKLKPGKE